MKAQAAKNEKGFALLFSVLLSSLLLSIGLSIFSISLKELAISTASRQSVYAFYAADSGLQCALYWDTKAGQIPTLVNDQNTGTIKCGGKSMTLTSPGLTDIPANEPTDNLPVDSRDPTGPDFYMTVAKSWADAPVDTKITTVITATGHDSTSGDRVERAIVETY